LFKHTRSRFMLLVLVLAVMALAVVASASAHPATKKDDGRATVSSIESLGMVTFETGHMFADTEVGGLSGITYDANRGVYYALSDERVGSRFYTVGIDLSDGHLDAGDVVFLDVTSLQDKSNTPYAPGSLDPEGIALASPGRLFISSEGDANAAPAIDPFVDRFNITGRQNKAYPVPDKFLPDGNETSGIRDNLAFENLAISPDRQILYTATENALHQDGPASSLTEESPSRFLQYALNPGRPGPEYVYMTSQIPKEPVPPDEFADNGLAEIAVLDNVGTILTLERSYAVGVGNTIRLFEASTQGATDVSSHESIAGATFTPMSKMLVADFEDDLGIVPDNVEGMTFGPTLPDGRWTLILVSDNNFNPSQITQVIALALEVDYVGD
jgi:hypothetical protein